jgi:NAD(P)-dependent dehydrogenase (short-subunit alcohol dehydrogenase family)
MSASDSASPGGNARLDGRVALIVGGGTGIGRGIAEAFVQAGARVVLAGRRAKPLRETREALGGEMLVHAEPTDITNAADRVRLVTATQDAFGHLDILVNAAGTVTQLTPLAETDEHDWELTLASNLTGPMLLARACLPLLRQRGGSILNIASGAALKPVPRYGAYGAAKAALIYASQLLALEAAPDVRVNVICPGGVDTPIFDTFLDPKDVQCVKDWFAKATPLGRMGKPADIAQAALYLASDAAIWVTGAVLTVDGGLNLG